LASQDQLAQALLRLDGLRAAFVGSLCTVSTVGAVMRRFRAGGCGHAVHFLKPALNHCKGFNVYRILLLIHFSPIY
jgi:hypothetical protein